MHNNICNIISLVLGSINLIAVILLFFMMKAGIKKVSTNDQPNIKDDNIEIYKLLIQEDAVMKIDNVLDTFIKNAGELYQILSLSTDQNHYITESQANEMSSYISGMVKKNLSDPALGLLGLTHRLDNEEDLNSIIDLRVKLYMINFIMEYNKLQNDNATEAINIDITNS